MHIIFFFQREGLTETPSCSLSSLYVNPTQARDICICPSCYLPY